MRIRLNLSLRRALLAVMACVTSFSSTVNAGLSDARYDLQYYLDFSYNMGMFSAGSTNITIYYKDGTSVLNPTIPLMPNLDSFGSKGEYIAGIGFMASGGSGLVAPQYLVSAAHCKETDVYFLTQGRNYSVGYHSTGYTAVNGLISNDWSVQRLNKIVTEVAYTPYADDAFMAGLSTNDTWLYRVGDGTYQDTNGGVATGGNAMGGICNISSITQKNTGTWIIAAYIRENDTPGDTRPPMEISVTSGDSGSPIYAWDAENNRFVQVGFASCGDRFDGYDSNGYFAHNPTAYDTVISTYDVAVSDFAGDKTILWGVQDAETGQGSLTQGDVVVDYVGKGSANTDYDTRGLVFATADAVNTQNLVLQGSVNMGAGALTFNSGSWNLSETAGANTFNSAGFVVNDGADLTVELTGSSSEEWRKVGEGTMTIAGSGNNDAALRVGGGTTQYLVTYDEQGNIIGCTLGNIGETRLDRADGYAAGSIRLEAGVAIVVLMRDGQIRTDQVAGDTFTFGNAGGLLNLNGHDLTWGVINQDGSGSGARIGNMTPLGEAAPGLATFTYTGTGQFDGCFVDEGSASSAKLAVVYDNADSGTWVLTGLHSNVGGFTVENGTMVLQGCNTPHTGMTDADDWAYAKLEGSDVMVRSGATFQLSHHALMSADIHVEAGGSFVLNQTVNSESESISGGLRQNMGSLGLTSLRGDVNLNGNATMTAATDSPVVTVMSGNVSGGASSSFSKTGHGVFEVDGKMVVGSGTISAGGLVVNDNADFGGTWHIAEQGFLSVAGLSGAEMLSQVTTDSAGIIALNTDQTEQVNLTNHSAMYIGAWGTVNYGAAGTVLNSVADAEYGKVWRLGGGTGTLNVLFRLSDDADGAVNLLVGNEWSSGTVHLANKDNDFTGDIIIMGTGNKLTYEDGALGGAKVALTYGNALGLSSADMVGIIKADSAGVLAASTSENLDLRGTVLSLGADGNYTYTGTLLVDDTYRLGGSGHLTVDTELAAADTLKVDGQGTQGSSVTFARENAFDGNIIAGGGLELAEPNSTGEVGIHVGHASALASAESINLQKGAVLYTDGRHIEVQNLSASTGSSIRNNGTDASLLLMQVEGGKTTVIADGVLSDTDNTGALHIIKSGAGTLEMGINSTWAGGMTISQGTVVANLTGTNFVNSAGGIGASAAGITVAADGTLRLNMNRVANASMGCTLLPQTISGTGTVVLASGGSAMFSLQSSAFQGSVKLEDNTRLYIGKFKFDNGYTQYDNRAALAESTIIVESGSQAKVTNALTFGSLTAISTTADFVISGNGYDGVRDGNLYASALREGALAIDNLSTVYGNITLADDAMISSSSTGTLQAVVAAGNTYIYGDASRAPAYATYGVKNYLGGIIRGEIYGAGKTLTFGGNEGMTITADSANTYGDLVIANGNGHNDDLFALRLDGGKAVSQTSTALGTGNVLLSDGLILRLAGTGVADNADVVYTYANNVTAGDGATIQSYNITNKLTGTVSMAGNSLNLATASGGVLHLAGGITGSGTLNIGADSQVILGAAESSFTGNIVAGAGASLTLESPASVGSASTITGTDSLSLTLGGAAAHGLASLTVQPDSATPENGSALHLTFDFSESTAESYTALSLGSLSADSTLVSLQLNMFGDVQEGVYTLVSGSDLSSDFVLADDLGGRLSLSVNGNEVLLSVGADSRLYWAANGESGLWSADATNWCHQGDSATMGYVASSSVMLDASGVAAGNSASSRETLELGSDQTVTTLAVKGVAYSIVGNHTLSGNQLVVGLGGDLQLASSASFADGVILNDGALTVDSATLTADVQAENGSAFQLQNGASLAGNLHLDGAAAQVAQASLNGNVQLGEGSSLALTGGTWNGSLVSPSGNINFGNAVVSGSLCVGLGADALYVAELDVLGGSVETKAELMADLITLTNGSLQISAACNINTLSVAAGKTVTLWNENAASGADKILHHVELGNNAVLQTNDRAEVTKATRIGSLQLNGAAATLQDVHHSGIIAVETLRLGDGVDRATLSLVKNAASTKNTIFSLGSATADAGNFVGTIELKELNTGAKRSAFIIVSNEDIAKNAVISFADAGSGDAHVGLGIDAAAVTIAGLNSVADDATRVKLFSGSLNVQSAWNTGDTSAPATVGTALHTLTINTAADTDCTFHGEVLENLNLVIAGEGKQTFNGTSSAFNGSIAVQGGTLALGENALGMLSTASSVTIGAGTLDVSAMDFSSSSINVEAGKSFSLTTDALLNLGSLSADTQYDIFNINGGMLDGWVNLSARNFIVDGETLAAKGRVALSLGMGGSFSYSMVDNTTLYWNGASDAEWDFFNLDWSTTSAGANAADNTFFCNGDSVVFASDAVVAPIDGIRVGTLTIDSGVSLTTVGSVAVDSVSMGANAEWILAAGTQQALTEAQLNGINAGSLVVEQGATLRVEGLAASANKVADALDAVLGDGTILLSYDVVGNGVAFDFSGITGTVQLDKGRIQLDTSVFGAESPDFRLTSADSQLVFNGSGTLVKSNIVLDATTTIHVNSNKSGAISGVVSGEGGLTKAGAGVLTLSRQNTYTGATTIDDGKIILATGGDYMLNNTVSGGTLEVAKGTTLLSNGKAISSALVLNGGNAVVSGNNNKSLKGNVTIQAGGMLSFSGSGSDMLDYNQSNKSITVNGGVLDFGSTRQTMGSWSLTLSNGAEVRGAGGSYGAAYTAAMDFDNNATITALSGENTISATTRLRGGNNRTLTYDVKDGASLTVSGRIHADKDEALGNIVKDGAGNLIVTSGLNVNTLAVNGGEMQLFNEDCYSLRQLALAAGTSLSTNLGTVIAPGAAADVRVSQSLVLGAYAQLNANLTFVDGAALTLNGYGDTAANITGELNLGSGLTLDGDAMSAIHSLQNGESLVLLFTGDKSVNATLALAGMPVSASSSYVADASAYFNTFEEGQYYVTFTDNAFSITAGTIPEPTTATLSLLALAALAMRRRRK